MSRIQKSSRNEKRVVTQEVSVTAELTTTDRFMSALDVAVPVIAAVSVIATAIYFIATGGI